VAPPEGGPIRVAVDASPLADGRRAAGIGRYVSGLIDALNSLPDAVELHVVGPRRAAASERWPYRYLRAQPAVVAGATKGRAEVFHATGGEPSVGWPLSRQVVTVHDVVPYEDRLYRTSPSLGPYLRLQRLLIRRCAAVIVPGTPVADDVVRVLGVARERVTVVASGVSPVFSPVATEVDERLAGSGRREGRYVLWVGSLHGPDRRKGLDVLLDAVEEMPDSVRPPVVLAGALGLGRSWVEDRALRRGVTVTFTGFVSDAQLAALYRGAAAVVVPSRFEGFGFPLLEAMACAAPVVATRAGTTPEVAGDAAVLIQPDAPAELSKALEAVLCDPTLARALREAGPHRARLYSWERTADATAAVYQRVRARRRRPPPLVGRSRSRYVG
jgi:glycosyltransferase involved in cell wall biosynthesis